MHLAYLQSQVCVLNKCECDTCIPGQTASAGQPPAAPQEVPQQVFGDWVQSLDAALGAGAPCQMLPSLQIPKVSNQHLWCVNVLHAPDGPGLLPLHLQIASQQEDIINNEMQPCNS